MQKIVSIRKPCLPSGASGQTSSGPLARGGVLALAPAWEMSMDEETRRVFAKIGTAVRKAQQLRGVTDAELSGRATIEPDALEQILSGEKEALPLHVIYLLAGALEVRPAQLMQGIEWVPDGEGGGAYRVEEPAP